MPARRVDANAVRGGRTSRARRLGKKLSRAALAQDIGTLQLVRMVKAFRVIKDGQLRRRLLGLVERIARSGQKPRT